MANPSRLRLVDCDLPDDVERQLIAFEDEFDAALQPFFEKFDAMAAAEIPGITAALAEYIALHDELLEGAPVKSLGSLQALEDNLGLTNPQREPSPETTRIDERKVGAANIALINGRMFRILSGTRIDGFRSLWYSVGGDYDAFILAGSAIFAQQAGTFAFYQSNPSEKKFPLVNKGFNRIFELTGYGPSVFIHNLFWNESIAKTTSNRLKLSDCGFSEDQLVNILSGQNVNADFDYVAAMETITDFIRDLSSLTFKPTTDPLRLPAWQLENTLINLILDLYFEYRTKLATNSYILNQTYFSLLLTNLRKEDLKELFEYRPELHDLELPPVPDTITLLVSNAVSIQAGTLINTYVNSLPETGLVTKSQLDFECQLFNLSFVLWQYFLQQFPDGAANLELKMRELQRTKVPFSPTTTTFCGESGFLDPEDYADILNAVTNTATSGLPPVGMTSEKFMEAMRRQFPNDIFMRFPNVNLSGLSSSGILINISVLTVKAAEKKKKEDTRKKNKTTSGSETGLPSLETIAELIARKVSWPDNFLNCVADANLSAVTGEQAESVLVDMDTGKELASTPPPKNPTPKEAAKYAAEVAVKTNGIAEPIATEEKAAKAATEAAKKAGEKLDPATALGRSIAKQVMKAAAEVERKKLEDPDYLQATTAEQRQQVVRNEGKPANTFSGSFELGACNPLFTAKIGQFLEKNRKKLEAWLIRMINVIQELIINVQVKIDNFLLRVQSALDFVLFQLEKILSIDINFSGKLGFENSLLKCAWSVDFGIKIDLLSILLQFLGQIFPKIGIPLRNLLGLVMDFMNNVYCIPLRLFESLVGGASALLGKIGCTVKDFRLPVEIEDLLFLIKGTFELRGLVIRTGISHWLDGILQLRSQEDEFRGLSQVAAICQSPSLGKTINAMANLSLSNAPIAVNSKPTISDLMNAASSL